jgi:hypothetical protein
MSDKVIAAVHTPFEYILSDILACFFVTDLGSTNHESTSFNGELFLTQMTSETLAFFTLFLRSMTFHFYLEKRVLKFKKDRGMDRIQDDESVLMSPQPREGHLQVGRARTKMLPKRAPVSPTAHAGGNARTPGVEFPYLNHVEI